jgi:hypothetical protein
MMSEGGTRYPTMLGCQEFRKERYTGACVGVGGYKCFVRYEDMDESSDDHIDLHR